MKTDTKKLPASDKTCSQCKSRLIKDLVAEVQELRAIRREAGVVAEAFIKFEVLNDDASGFVDPGALSEAEDALFAAVSSLKDAMLRASKKRGKRGGK